MQLNKIIRIEGEHGDRNSLMYKEPEDRLFASKDFGRTWHDITSQQLTATSFYAVNYTKEGRKF